MGELVVLRQKNPRHTEQLKAVLALDLLSKGFSVRETLERVGWPTIKR